MNEDELETGNIIDDDDVDLDDILGAPVAIPAAAEVPDIKVTPTDTGEANNVFAGIEEHLNLPLGSTKEGIKIAKAESKKIVTDVKTVTAQANIVKSKEEINETLPAPRYDAQTLANDRAEIRNRAWKVYEIGEKWLTTLDEQIMSTIAPTDQNWGAAAKMYDSVNKALQGLMKLLTSLRQEDDLASLKLANDQSESDVDLDNPDSLGKGREMSTQEVNAKIEEWGKERDEEVRRSIEAAQTKRLADMSEAKTIGSVAKTE